MLNCFLSNDTKETLFHYKLSGSQFGVLYLTHENVFYAGITERAQVFHMVASSMQIVYFDLANDLLCLKILSFSHHKN